jgi:hypothetical protein
MEPLVFLPTEALSSFFNRSHDEIAGTAWYVFVHTQPMFDSHFLI